MVRRQRVDGFSVKEKISISQGCGRRGVRSSRREVEYSIVI